MSRANDREYFALVWTISEFQPYIFGRPSTVVIDHHVLCWLSSLKDPTGRLGRWALQLQQYLFSVVHKCGQLHQDADCPSRYPVDPPYSTNPDTDACVLSVYQFLHFGDEQRRDPTLRSIIDSLSFGASDESPRMFT